MKQLYLSAILYFSAILFIMSHAGCASDFEHFNQSALEFAVNDNKIDENEFQKLIMIIEQSNEMEFQRFKVDVDNVDSLKVFSYLFKYLSAKRLDLEESDIWRPQYDTNVIETFNINFFVENSGSMNGYVGDPNTKFKSLVFSLLTRLKFFVNKDSLNLYFINNSDQLLFENASEKDVKKFKDLLTPSSFSTISKGRTSETDLNELINKCLEVVDDRSLSVFISDCIYSPGNLKPDVVGYCREQKYGIYMSFAKKIRDRNTDVAVIVLQVSGGFKGTYYGMNDKEISFNNTIERPFYVWFIGTKLQIEKIIESNILEQIDGGYMNKLILQAAINENLRFSISSKPLYGTFDRTNLTNNIIEDPKPAVGRENAGLFGFTIAVDFSKSFQDASYYTDTANYVLSNINYKIIKIRSIVEQSEPNLNGFTHLIEIQTSKIQYGVLEIHLIGKTPGWVYKYSSDNDLKILNDTSQQQKTFGLKYLIEGVSDAFYEKPNTNIIGTIRVTIKK